MSTYLVTRTETIQYAKEYTREELIALGVPPEVFDGEDLAAEFQDFVFDNLAVYNALEEDTEKHADVQGSNFKIRTVK